MTTRDDDLFRPKLSPPRARGPGKPQSFIKRVLNAAHKSGKGIGQARYSSRTGQRPGARLGRGHTIAKFADAGLGARSRRAIIKSRIVQFKAASPRTAALHLRYI